ncbi:hypothetical protein D3C87_2001810 [compost metagenome]
MWCGDRSWAASATTLGNSARRCISANSDGAVSKDVSAAATSAAGMPALLISVQMRAWAYWM